jgi:Cdc6-like AAA superfamily ATPase
MKRLRTKKVSQVLGNASPKNLLNGSPENSLNGSPENSLNDILERLSNKSLYKLQNIVCEDIAWDAPVAKQFILIYWIKLTIQEKEGNFITTRDIYEQYKKNCNALNEKVILTKASFYRLIWNSLLTAKIMYVKSQENGQKGIRGIQFKSIENN